MQGRQPWARACPSKGLRVARLHVWRLAPSLRPYYHKRSKEQGDDWDELSGGCLPSMDEALHSIAGATKIYIK